MSGAGLCGRRVLVTRAPHQASELVERLRVAGAEAVLIPTIEIAPPESYCGLDAALACVRSFEWVVFTSANAVEAFVLRAQRTGCAQAPRKIAVVGPGTERAVRAAGFEVELMPTVYTAEALLEALAAEAAGKSVLLVRAAVANEALPEGLAAAGGVVTCVEAYRNALPKGSIAAMRVLFADRGRLPDAVTFTSASTARNLRALLDAGGLALPDCVVRASIGPVTSRAMAELGMPAHVEAAEATVAALVEALVTCFQQRAE